AARAVDVRGATPSAPKRLRINESIAAGTSPQHPIAAGEVARIFTGAPLPAGADSVIRQEDVEREVAHILVQRDRDAGGNVRRAGMDLQAGAIALRAGAVLGPHQVALLAALAVAHPVVHRRPRVGILTSGDELVSLDHPDDILAGRRLADANSPALAALVTEAGGIAVPLGIARDTVAELERMVGDAGEIDFLITAGGVSVGDHDHVRTVMAACDVRTLFDRVRLRPGGPTTFGLFPGGRPWLALPGNPVSAMVTFELFARPAIRAMAGHRLPFRPVFPVRLADEIRCDATLEQYVRVTFERADHGALAIARVTGAQGSGMLMSIARADGLAIIPAGTDVLAAGSTVSALRFG
ncbi:MAG: gephyrin-like molybdotransferase Glp, partial [Gemmatimonadota bacterium]